MPDWYDIAGLSRSPYKTDGKPDWNSFYGGDIEGVRKNLDYLSDLGVTVIYFNPLFEAKSNHKYDAATFTRIDPHFGTNDEFRRFVGECHDRGIRVVIDLAINHTGHTFWAFTDARRRGRASTTWDWYEWASWPVPGGLASTPSPARDYYDCWWGFGQMPNLNFDLSRAGGEEQGVRRDRGRSSQLARRRAPALGRRVLAHRGRRGRLPSRRGRRGTALVLGALPRAREEREARRLHRRRAVGRIARVGERAVLRRGDELQVLPRPRARLHRAGVVGRRGLRPGPRAREARLSRRGRPRDDEPHRQPRHRAVPHDGRRGGPEAQARVSCSA